MADMKPAESSFLTGSHSYQSVTQKFADIVLRRPLGLGWVAGFLVSAALLGLLLIAITWLFIKGIGIWGVNIPVAWGFAIVNFVWWIGIGHAGTLISAILLLLRQPWRTSINRFAEAMTLFAVACAALFPILHLGRPYLFYYLMPYPNSMDLWPQFRSPLIFDVFAVTTYGTVSLVFWYMGLIPDLASMRDVAKHPLLARIFGVLALGWRGSAAHWSRYNTAYLLLAGLATPLVVSVHTIVSFDFAVSILPGWHTTIFPPYFVAGAIYSGFAMVLSLLIPIRHWYGLEDFITARHLANMAKVMLATGIMVAYGYLMEAFMAFYSGNIFEMQQQYNRMQGPYAPAYWALLACNVVIPQLLWLRRVRASAKMLWVLAFVINIGMWLERFVIIIASLSRDFLPSSWHVYYPTLWDWATFLGTFGLFFTLLFLFVRALPLLAMAEMREFVHKREHES